MDSNFGEDDVAAIYDLQYTWRTTPGSYAGRPLVMSWHIESVTGGVVSMTETTAEADGTVLHVGHGKLRFLDPSTLNGLLKEAGFAVEAQFGDFKRGPITSESRTIMTVARA
jgi:hypothetical protein